MGLSSEELELLADNLLKKDYEEKRRNKSRVTEYSFLSESQLKRRTLTEIPYSNLTEKQRLECKTKNMDYYGTEVD